MAESRLPPRPTTPESQLHDDLGSSPIKHTVPQVDIEKRDKWSLFVYPKVHTEMEPEEMLSKLCPNYGEINGLAPEVPKMERTEATSSKSTYCDYLNKLSTSVRGKGILHTPYILWL
jgi:hypothetical protein